VRQAESCARSDCSDATGTQGSVWRLHYTALDIPFYRRYILIMRTGAPDLLPMFRSDMQVELLSLVVLQPDRTWTLDGLAEQLDTSPSSVHRELHRLLGAGIVYRDAGQRPHSYRVATDSPAYSPLRGLLDVTAGVPMRLARELSDVPGLVAATIHGSWAAGAVRPDSDLDVILITDGDRRAAQRAARRIGKEIGRDVDASVLSRKEYESLRREHNPFLGKILHGPRIDVIGDLAALGAAR
jgi:predicted nucleotidyltransferase